MRFGVVLLACLVPAWWFPGVQADPVDPTNPPPVLFGDARLTETFLNWSAPVPPVTGTIDTWILTRDDNGAFSAQWTFPAGTTSYSDTVLPDADHVFTYSVIYETTANTSSPPSNTYTRGLGYPRCDPLPPPYPSQPRLYCFWPPPKIIAFIFEDDHRVDLLDLASNNTKVEL